MRFDGDILFIGGKKKMKGKEELRTPASLRILRRKALAFALAFALVFSTMMSMIPVLKVKATVNYADYVNTTNSVEFNGNDWYIIEYDSTAETVTLLSKECVGASVFSNSNNVNYDNSDLKIYLADYYNNTFPSDGKTAIVDNEELYIPSEEEITAITNMEVRKCSQPDGAVLIIWWLSTPSETSGVRAVINTNGYINNGPIEMKAGVRPALKLDLSKVTFSSNTFTVVPSQSHTHSWNIVASGSTATVKCVSDDGDCPYTINQEYRATISATSKAYDGTAVTASITTDTGFPTEITIGDISYSGLDGTNYPSSTTAPSAVGKYRATSTVSDGTNTENISVDYEITKATSSLITEPTGSTGMTFNGYDRALLASSGTANGGTLYYRLGADGEWKTTQPTAKFAGDYVIYYYVKGNSNYNDYGSEIEPVGSIDVSIAKKTITISEAQAEDKEYDGTNTASFRGSLTITGGVFGYSVTPAVEGAFSDSKPGNNKTVTVTNVTLTGQYKDNYIAIYDTSETLTANITIVNGSTLTKTVTQADGTIVRTDTTYQNNEPETIVETTTSADGKTVSVVEKDASDVITKTTETITNVDGTKTVTITEEDKITIETKDSEGNTIKTVETVTNADGSTTETEKDALNRITKVTENNTDGSKVVTENTYDNEGTKTGSVVTTTSADGKTVTVETKDSEGNVTKTVETVTNTDGSTTVTEKNSSDNVTKETVTNADGSKEVTENSYDSEGNKNGSVVTTTSADRKTVTVEEKDASDNITKTTVTKKDASDTVVKTTVTVNNSDGTKTITETNADGSSKVTEKNSSDNVTKETVTNADGSKVVTENSYDSSGNKTGSVVTTTSADGKTVTVKEKDASDETTKTTKTVTNADGTKTVTTTEGNTTTVETKDGNGNTTKTVETVTNTDGSKTVTEKDASGNITKETVTNSDGSKVVTENSYDSEDHKTGSVVTTTSSDGKTVTVETKDSDDNITKTVETVTDTDGSTTITTTSADGKTVTVEEKDESGETTKTTKTVTNADGTKTVTTTEGNKVTVETKDSNDITTNKVETVTNADGSKTVTENLYNNAGDKTGSVVTTTSADGKTVTVEEKDASDVTTKTTETVTNADGTKTVTTTEGNTTTVETKDSEGNTTGSTVTTTSEDGKTVTVETKDSEGNTTKTVQTVTNSDGAKTVTTTDGNTTTVETFDNSGETTSVIRQESNDQSTAVKAVEEIGEAPDTILNDEVDELVDKLISDEEKVRQQNGELVMIVLDVEDVTDTVSSEDIAKVAAILQNGEKAGGYFEINLYKQIGASERIQITDTNSEKISISMRIPDELLNHDDNVERTYYIARLHDGKAEIIDSTTDLVKQLITFETDKFSIYAITYIDKVITNQNTNTTDTSNTQDKTNITDPTSTPNSQVDKDNQNVTPAEVKTPDNANNADNKSSEQTKVSKDNNALSTGDKMHLGIVIMLMIDSCLAALYLTLKKRLR